MVASIAFSMLAVAYAFGGVSIGGATPCPSGSPIGVCFGVATDTFFTAYTNGGNGYISPTVGGCSSVGCPLISTSSTPLISELLQSNQQASQWLITCPATPNTYNTMEYFSTGSYISGDRCLANDLPLVTFVMFTTSTVWTPFSPAASTIHPLVVKDAATGSISDLAYSGETNVGSSAYNISNGYNTQSYIFGQVPSSSQAGIWTWHSNYADFSNADVSHLSYSQNINKLWLMFPPGIGCIYTYDYSVQASVLKLQNANIPVPQYNKSALSNGADYLEFGGYLYSPVKQLGTSSCSTSLQEGQPCDGWTKVSSNGTLGLSGQTYNSLYVYYGTRSGAGNPSPDYQYSLIAAYPGGIGEANAIALNYTNASQVAYFNYNLSMPTARSQFAQQSYLNESYNLYSTHNYANPGNFLDQFALGAGSGLFANYSGYLTMFPLSSIAMDNSNTNGFNDMTSNFLSILSPYQASVQGFSNGGKAAQLGQFALGDIPDPAYITASPDGYVYVISYSTACHPWCWIKSDITTYLYAFKFVPQGYYNLSNQQPNSLGNQGRLSDWLSQWQNYYSNAFLEGTQGLYLLGVYKLASAGSEFFGLHTTAPEQVALQNFVPLAAQTDDNGNLFMLGLNKGVSNGFEIAAIPSEKGVPLTENDQITQSVPSGIQASQEFAVSPGGQFAYVANVSDPGYIFVYNVGLQAPGSSTASSSAFGAYSGNIALSYSNDTSNMDIAQYLSNGGPFGDPQVAKAWSAYKSTDVPDVPSYHHPVSITDSKGILYVVDNWTFEVGGQFSSVLMLRAFAENGTEVPIDPQYLDTMTTPSNALPPLGWRPYGWPLSANISLPDGQSVSYCSFECKYSPNNLPVPSAYQPIGPRITANGGFVGKQPGLSVSSDFNGTLYMLAHVYSFNFLDQAGQEELGQYAYADSPLYSELLVLHPAIQNYTSISYLANSSYACFLSAKPPSNSVCTYTPNTEVIASLNPPLIGAPDAFSYAESLGSPEQYLNFQNSLSSLLPQGIDSSKYSKQASNVAQNGYSGTSDYGNALTGPVTSNLAPPANIPDSYLKSSIAGYLITPYNYTTELKQSWSTVSSNPTNPFWFICVPVSLIAKLYGDPSDQKQNTFTYITTSLKSNQLNLTIEGGSTYLQSLPLQQNFVENLSDASAIYPPRLYYELFTSRLFGEAYVNQTISPKTAQMPAASRYGLPLVVNASHSYDYNLNGYVQLSTLGSFAAPAYYQQSATGNVKFGANCGGTCLNPLGGIAYYYSLNPLNYMSDFANLTYAISNSSQITQLFEYFKAEKYAGEIGLNFSGNQNIFGYNRLVFTYIDRFNNTIYMPMDVDFANITSITTSASTNLDQANTNQTSITVNGIATYTTANGVIEPLPAGSQIYLYWNQNLDYYNTITTSPQTDIGYAAASLSCALDPSTRNCTAANPLSTLTQKQPMGLEESQLVTYHTERASTGTGCPVEPSSLLKPIVYNCNIYGTNGLKSVQPDPNIPGAFQYCQPFTSNGEGFFTSQMGLIGIAKTDASGAFNYQFTACGVGQNRLTAYYYGASAPEPILVSQTALSNSGGVNEFPSSLNQNALIQTQEYNYGYAPNYSIENMQIGSYSLPFGSINAYLAAAIAFAVIAAIRLGRRK